MRLLPPFAELGEASAMQLPSAEPEIDLPVDASSLDFLQAIYRDPRRPMPMRMRAAIAALPFERPKLAVIAKVPGGNMAAHIEAAIARSGKRVVIDAKPLAIGPPRNGD